MKVTIAGAGLAGLIAGVMLRSQVDRIVERNENLPNNHAALLRFRTGIVGDAVGIPLIPVKVMKCVKDGIDPINDALAYSLKVGGKAVMRSITTAKGEVEQRYIAPATFIRDLADNVMAPIQLGSDIRADIGSTAIISTIPMPTLMKMLDYKPYGVSFNSTPGWVINYMLPADKVDACATYYYPRPSTCQYRASITRNMLIIEGAGSDGPNLAPELIIRECLHDFGIPSVCPGSIDGYEIKQQQYAKIMPIDDSERRKFIMWASEHYGIHSLGRFATWRPGLMLDDIVNDVRVIQKLAAGDNSHPYQKRKA